MLQKLLIRNIALIDEIELSFGTGLHVMTGETGAGKSIVVDAVNLLLGGRADKNLIRTGCTKAYAEGLFDVSDSGNALMWLQNNEIETDEGCVTLSREISQTGRGVCRIQGISVSIAMLKEFSALLMDIHGQHEHQSLMDERNHLAFLDLMGDSGHAVLKREVAEAFSAYHDAVSAYKKMKQESVHREERLLILKQQEEELASAKLTEGEEESLKAERERFRNSEKITQALREAYGDLGDSASVHPAVEQVRGAMRALAGLSSLGSDYEELAKRCESVFYDLEDVEQTVRGMLDAMDDRPERAAEVEERLDLIRKLSRKYGTTVEEMLKALARIQKEIQQFESMDSTLEALHKKALSTSKIYQEAAKNLSEARKKLAVFLQKRMEEQLEQLNMRGTRFFVEFEETGVSTAEGTDSIRFLIAPNAGEEKKPLAQIASGGEISRVMLALKSLTAEHDNIPSMVFDEIDTGISGRTAQVVAQKMWDIARFRQVICVTHLQQIAAMATHHFMVHKFEMDGRTHSDVSEIAGFEREKEIARMLSGVSEESESAVLHARSMLSEAEEYRRKTV